MPDCVTRFISRRYANYLTLSSEVNAVKTHTLLLLFPPCPLPFLPFLHLLLLTQTVKLFVHRHFAQKVYHCSLSPDESVETNVISVDTFVTFTFKPKLLSKLISNHKPRTQQLGMWVGFEPPILWLKERPVNHWPTVSDFMYTSLKSGSIEACVTELVSSTIRMRIKNFVLPFIITYPRNVSWRVVQQ